MATLPLPSSSGARVFRKVIEILRSDDALATIQSEWGVGLTKPATTATFTRPPNVGIRLRPEIGPSTWYSPDSHVSQLTIHVYIEIEGYDEDDMINLWDAIVHAIYPRNDLTRRQQIQQELREAGAETGLPLFRTAYDPDRVAGFDGRFRGDGEIRIAILDLLNP